MTRCRAILWAVLVVAGCATLAPGGAGDRDLERQLAAWQSPEPLDRVWQEARRLLAARGFPLADKDADAVGQRRMNPLERLGSPARATVERGPNDRTLETGWSESRHRYVLQSLPTAAGFQIVLWRIDEGADGRPVQPRRDLALELELVRRVDPAGAERIEATLGAASAASR